MNRPRTRGKDDMYSTFEEMIDVFKTEASNQERITKTTEKMKARIAAGYYPGSPKARLPADHYSGASRTS